MATLSNTVSGLCDRVLARLGDSEATSWDKCQIQTAVNDSLWMLAILRPQLFTREVVILLASGDCVQTLPEECPSLVGFKCVEINGTRTPVSQGDFSTIESTALHPPSRRSRGGKRSRADSITVASYQVSLNPDNPRTFAISPLPQDGDTVKLIADCVSVEDFQLNDCEEFPTEVNPYLIPLTELSLYQLYSTDRESPEVAALANASLQAFTQITAITQGALNAVLRQQQQQADA